MVKWEPLTAPFALQVAGLSRQIIQQSEETGITLSHFITNMGLIQFNIVANPLKTAVLFPV